TGQYQNGYRHGKGKMVYANGDIYEGLWEDGDEAEGKTTLAKHKTDEKYFVSVCRQ
ncbi:MAG: 2-isopropylmalate synthase, partial [Pseudomonadota bacterium]|nr:2-isopropylmalate synthase [Pseudomonadota bacterium]